MLTAEVLALTTRVETHVAVRTPPALATLRAPWFIGLPPTCGRSPPGTTRTNVGQTTSEGPHPFRAGGRRPGRSLEDLVGSGDGEGVASPGHPQFGVQAGDVGL